MSFVKLIDHCKTQNSPDLFPTIGNIKYHNQTPHHLTIEGSFGVGV